MLGLNDKEVAESRKKHGSNEIRKRKKNSFFGLLIESLGDPIIRILLIALGIKTIFLLKDFDWYETVGIVIAIFLASFISSISEYGSEKAFDKLQSEASKIKCRVKRNNQIIEISIDEVVVNDIVILEAGDKVPADGIIVEGNVSVDESSLNGEAKEIYKELSDPVYRGTVIYSNYALMRVNRVGSETFFGKLAEEIQEKQADSPLKIRLRKLAEFISKVGYIGAFLVSLSYLFSAIVVNNHFNTELIMETITNGPLIIGHILYALTLSVTIIVVAVPEGLPMMITLVLSSNM
ncbi:MAG: HAD-IC family P-type ATPase, partial [Bacilli bacterium]|nr:HAD-IC family P-type ATPase [Bacilli bacterium]